MPWNKVMPQFGKGTLHSGSKQGPKVKNKKQALAIMFSEKQKGDEGDTEYQPTKPKIKGKGLASISNSVKRGKINTGPSMNFKKRMNLSA